MSGRARLFSEYITEASEYHSTSRTFIPNHPNLTPALASINTPDSVRETKRRKTTGLNSRFDRMVETISVMHHPQVKLGRQRTVSASSSSVSSHDLPKTPADAYSGLQEGKLGKTFSLIKMVSSSVPRTSESWRKRDTSGSVMDDDDPSTEHQLKISRKPLPEWLSSTFATLSAQHPLRLLLPSSNHHTSNETVATDPVDQRKPLVPRSDETEGSVFAFYPLPEQVVTKEPAHQDHESPVLELEPLPTLLQRHFVSPVHAPDFTFPPLQPPLNGSSSGSSAFNNNPQSSNILPFSTPGPGSSVSQSVLSSSDLRFSLAEDFKTPSVRPLMDWSSFSPPVHSMVFRLPPTIARPADPAAAAAYLSDDTPNDYPSDEDLATDDSSSDPHLQAVYTNSHLFSTPGPVYHISRAIYFDSPTEDPADSDPSQPGYDLDHDALDFRWVPFIRNGVDDEGTAHFTNIPDQSKKSPQSNSLIISQGHPPLTSYNISGDEDTGELLANTFDVLNPNDSFPLTSSPKRYISPNPFRFSPSMDNAVLDHSALLLSTTESYDESEECPSTPELQPQAPFFAPAPGIFISPLRNLQSSQSEDQAQIKEQNGQDIKPGRLGILDNVKSSPSRKGKNLLYGFLRGSQIHEQGSSEMPTCSQVSNDSIESWKDVDL